MHIVTKNYYHKLADQIKENNLLNNVCTQLKQEFNLTPCLGAELEFYLDGEYDLYALENKIHLTIKKEKGKDQFEIDLPPSTDIIKYAALIEKVRTDISYYSNMLGFSANFSSKPFPDDYGNSMHIHLNFLEDDDVEKYAKILCHYSSKYLKAFLPKLEDYKRLDNKFMAPTHISYGGNNRSTLIRIPDSIPRRLEHRLAAASANSWEVFYAILVSILDGLRNPGTINNIKKIYGNASDSQYNLARIL